MQGPPGAARGRQGPQGARVGGAADLQRAEAAVVRMPVGPIGLFLLLGHARVGGGGEQDTARDAAAVLAVDDDGLTW